VVVAGKLDTSGMAMVHGEKVVCPIVPVDTVNHTVRIVVLTAWTATNHTVRIAVLIAWTATNPFVQIVYQHVHPMIMMTMMMLRIGASSVVKSKQRVQRELSHPFICVS
jgi:hypothetical protein